MLAFVAFVCLSLSSILWASPKIRLQDIENTEQISKFTTMRHTRMKFHSHELFSENSFNDLEIKNLTLKLLKKTKDEWVWTFLLHKIPICGYYLKDVLMKDARTVYTVGQIPNIRQIEDSDLKEDLNLHDLFENQEDVHILNQSKCYFVKNGHARLVWNLTVGEKLQIYKVWMHNGEILLNAPLALDVQTTMGHMQVFSGIPEQSPLTTLEYPVYTDGSLTNDFFVTDTLLNSTLGVPRAVASDDNFIYPTSDVRFPEVSAFVNAMNVLSYFNSLGYTADSTNRVVLSLHNVFEGSPNNSAYYPATSSPYKLPSILYGDGDGVAFGNFPVEPDITSHEFSHHVVYGYLFPDTTQGSILHEGLADFFAEMRSNSSCFAPSICLSSNFCMGKCLRNAINSVMYTDSSYSTSEVHYQSLAISGMLWSVKETLGTGLDHIVYGALKYLSFTSGFANFFNALFLADLDLHNGANACVIYDAIVAKGFQVFVPNIDCKTISSIRTQTKSPATKTTSVKNPNTDTSSSNSKSKKCAMIFVDGQNTNPPFSSVFLFLLPIVFFLFRAFVLRIHTYLLESDEF